MLLQGIRQKDMATTTTDRRFVIVVEDDVSALEAVALYLEHLGFNVTSAANADNALALASDNRPHIAVCDWHLGGGANGVDVARQLQQSYGTQVIFMTAFPIDELQDATNDIDVRAFLKKPLSLAVLADAVETL